MRYLLLPTTLLTLLSLPVSASEPPSSIWRLGLPASALAMGLANVTDADAMSVGVGQSDNVFSTEIGLRWNLKEPEKFTETFSYDSYFQINYTLWQMPDSAVSFETTNNTIDVIQGFRWYFAEEKSWLSYLNTTLGISAMSNKEIDDKKLGGHFQFTQYAGLGGYITPKWNWDFGVRHYSNNDMYRENEGINFYRFNISYNYDHDNDSE